MRSACRWRCRAITSSTSARISRPSGSRRRATPGSAPTCWAPTARRPWAAPTCSCSRSPATRSASSASSRPTTATLSSPGDTISFAAPAATAAAAVKRLKEMGADLVVALTHLNFADDQQLVAGVDGVDLVLGGHDHEAMTFYEGDTLIAKAGSDLHFLVAIDLQVGRAMVKDKEVVVWTPSWRYVADGRGDAGAGDRGRGRALEHRARPGAGGAGRRDQGRARHPPRQRAHRGDQFRRSGRGCDAQRHRRRDRRSPMAAASAATGSTRPAPS